jgi:hypothetical protein
MSFLDGIDLTPAAAPNPFGSAGFSGGGSGVAGFGGVATVVGGFGGIDLGRVAGSCSMEAGFTQLGSPPRDPGLFSSFLWFISQRVGANVHSQSRKNGCYMMFLIVSRLYFASERRRQFSWISRSWSQAAV